MAGKSLAGVCHGKKCSCNSKLTHVTMPPHMTLVTIRKMLHYITGLWSNTSDLYLFATGNASFFGLRGLKASLPVMAALWLSVLGATIAHFQVDTWAGLAFVPYMVWVTVAAALNWQMAQLNPDVERLRVDEL